VIAALVELLARLAVNLLGWYMEKYAKDEQAKRDYIAFVEIMNRKGLSSVQLRKKATEQVDRVRDLWGPRGPRPGA
jgi:hypothetical protein